MTISKDVINFSVFFFENENIFYFSLFSLNLKLEHIFNIFEKRIFLNFLPIFVFEKYCKSGGNSCPVKKKLSTMKIEDNCNCFIYKQ